MSYTLKGKTAVCVFTAFKLKVNSIHNIIKEIFISAADSPCKIIGLRRKKCFFNTCIHDSSREKPQNPVNLGVPFFVFYVSVRLTDDCIPATAWPWQEKNTPISDFKSSWITLSSVSITIPRA